MADSPACPHARYAALRSAGPVFEAAPGTWVITGLREAQSALRDWQSFSAKVGETNDFEMFGPSPVMAEIAGIMADYPETPALIRTDPPQHGRVRDVVARVLTPSQVKTFEPRIAAIVEELSAPWLAQGTVDFTGSFAGILPGAVTTEFLCGDPAMRPKFAFWAGEIMSRLGGPQAPERQLEVAHNVAAMGRYFLDLLAARRAVPADDLVSLLANARPDTPIDDVLLVNVLETFMVGGNETTTFLLGHALIRLAEDPALAARLRADLSLVPALVEEVLRLESPAQSLLRRTTRAVDIGGAVIPAGATVMIALVAANRDGAMFDDADALQLDRPAVPRHVAFGYGNHACLGLQLARSEARIALQYLLPRMHDIRLAGPVAWIENDFLRGPASVPLTFTPA